MASIEATTPSDGVPHAAHAASGRPTLCLHCSTGSSRQWRALATALAEGRTFMAPDLMGYGDNPPWPRGRRLRLDEEVERLMPLLAAAGRPVDVVAHSFGAAVAVKLALAAPGRVRSLCLYEPVLFGLLKTDSGAAAVLGDGLTIRANVDRALAAGEVDQAAATFIDFWSGPGTWEDMPEARRADVRERMGKVCADFDALFDDETTAADLARLDVPVLCLSGGRSPAVTRRIADILDAALPRVQSTRIDDAGHMGPLTHANAFATSIESFYGFLSWREKRGAIDHSHTGLPARAA